MLDRLLVMFGTHRDTDVTLSLIMFGTHRDTDVTPSFGYVWHTSRHG